MRNARHSLSIVMIYGSLAFQANQTSKSMSRHPPDLKIEDPSNKKENYHLRSKDQPSMIGNWEDYWGHQLSIKPDSTFRFTWHFDLYGGWSIGNWRARKDTIFFFVKPVYDTVRYFDGTKKLWVDSLVLSANETPEVFNNFQSSYFIANLQNTNPIPNFLILHHGKLYGVNKSGHLDKSKARGIPDARFKAHLWYFKSDKKD